MSRITRWDETVPCIRPDVAHGDDTCPGTVRVHGYDDPGRSSGRVENCYPPEGESLADACDTCGYDEWTDEEIKEMLGKLSDGSESYDDYGERGEPEYWEDR